MQNVGDIFAGHRRAWDKKRALRLYYQRDIFERIVAQLRPGATLEIGTGPGFFADYHPGMTGLDIAAFHPGGSIARACVRRKASGPECQMPDRRNTPARIGSGSADRTSTDAVMADGAQPGQHGASAVSKKWRERVSPASATGNPINSTV